MGRTVTAKTRYSTTAIGAGVIAAAIGLPAAACTPAPVRCQSVAFAPQTDWVAADIVATGVSCTTARSVVYASKYVSRNYYSSQGFFCLGHVVYPQGMAYTAWACATGAKKITWKGY
jgi:hypothetical protein